MLFQPSNIAPSTLSGIGIGTVDVTKGIDVSWQVNGDSPMTAYQITIYQNDSASTQMYTTGEITLGTPFQPHDVYGNPMFFSTSIGAATLSAAGIVNGYANGYKMLITQWWGANDYVEQSSASVFITNDTPILTIDALPSPVTTNTLTITASFSQAQGDTVSSVSWVLAIAGLEDNPIKETGAVNTQILSFDVDGLLTGNTYSVECNVVTSSGMEVSTGFVPFTVSYSAQQGTIDYQLAQMRNSSAVYLSWESMGNNVLSFPYQDSTKTTNGIMFTVNGEGDVVANGTALADAKFCIAKGTLSGLNLTAGNKILVTSGFSGTLSMVEEIDGSNLTVSTVTGKNPLQYTVPSTANTLAFYIVVPNGTTVSNQQLQPMLFLENRIKNLDSLSATITPIQNLNGYDHPWPAGGGVNLFPDALPANAFAGSISSAGVIGTATNSQIFYFPCEQNTDYTCTKNAKASWTGLAFSNTEPQIGDTVDYRGSMSNRLKWTQNSGNNTYIVCVVGSVSAFNELVTTAEAMIVKGSTEQPYSPYSNICPITGLTGLSVYVSPSQDVADATTYAVDWTSDAGTVYGGTLDVVTGVLTVDRVIADLGDNNWVVHSSGNVYAENFVLDWVANRSAISSQYVHVADVVGVSSVTQNGTFAFQNTSGGIRTRIIIKDDSFIGYTAEQVKSALAGVQVVYELATPITYQLTPYQVAMLYGTNNVWNNSADTTLTYAKNTGTQATLSGSLVTFSDSIAEQIPTPSYLPGVNGISIYRYIQGDNVLRHVYDFTNETTTMLDYFVPSQTEVSYVFAAHGASDVFIQTSTFKPTFWFYSILLCDQDSNGRYHVRKEYAFKYGIETGGISNNNNPTIQPNFTKYPTRQPINTLYKTGHLKGYIGTVSDGKVYTDTIPLQNAIFEISTSTLTKFLKTRKGETLMVECSSPIQMQTGDNMREQPLVATIEWVEVGDASETSIVSIPSDSFWPL